MSGIAPNVPGSVFELTRLHDRARLGALVEATKPRITKMVAVTAGVGFLAGAVGRSWTFTDFLVSGAGCLLGTALSSGGANTLNQWMERDRDARMHRTRSRPLPSGRVTPARALAAGVVLSLAGLGVLWAAAGPVAALVSLATIVTYLAVYTPLKPVTPLATLIGAVPGALPPLIGWVSARPEAGFAALSDPGAWALFLIMFVWQVPHFLAIAWMYREDYARGGYRVLPAVDPSGWGTSAAILVWTAVLVPVTVAPAALMRDGPGPGYVAVALVTGVAFLALAVRLCRQRTRELARATFVASIIHLPVLLVVLVADTAITAIW